MYSCLYLSGGIGKRTNSKIPKQFLKVLKKPILIYPLEVILNIDEIYELIITTPVKYFDLTIKTLEKYELIIKNDENIKENEFKNLGLIIKSKTLYGINNKKIIIINGGETRQYSVLNGLLFCSHNHLLLHESSRPVVSEIDFKNLIYEKNENVTYGLEIPFTVLKTRGGFINEILDRNSLINIQLPQKFNKNQLLKAHINAYRDKKAFTDDSSLLFYYGGKIKVLKGKPENIKITYKNDINMIKGFLKK